MNPGHFPARAPRQAGGTPTAPEEILVAYTLYCPWCSGRFAANETYSLAAGMPEGYYTCQACKSMLSAKADPGGALAPYLITSRLISLPAPAPLRPGCTLTDHEVGLAARALSEMNDDLVASGRATLPMQQALTGLRARVLQGDRSPETLQALASGFQSHLLTTPRRYARHDRPGRTQFNRTELQDLAALLTRLTGGAGTRTEPAPARERA